MPRKRLADLLREEATKALVNEGNVPVEPTLETQITTLTSELDQARQLGLDLQNQVVDLQQQLQRQFFRADNLERDLIELQVVKAELNQAKRVIEELSEIRVALEQTALEHVVVETVIPQMEQTPLKGLVTWVTHQGGFADAGDFPEEFALSICSGY
ncbi:MAG: hypothetical protein LVT47_07280 [Cyanobacteria bacterium LVE1205-1]|jgi:uncharacterized protein (DUF342 family)